MYSVVDMLCCGHKRIDHNGKHFWCATQFARLEHTSERSEGNTVKYWVSNRYLHNTYKLMHENEIRCFGCSVIVGTTNYFDCSILYSKAVNHLWIDV